MALGWMPQWQFAGYLVADHKGFYEEEGLEVQILPGGPDYNGMPLLASGQIEFTSPGPASIWNARLKDMPIVTLLTAHQRAPYSYMVLADSGIEHPLDFEGKKVMIFDGDMKANFDAVAAAVGLDTSTVTEIPGTFDISPLLTGEIDVLQVYATDEPEIAREMGYDVNLLWGSDYGVAAIGDTLVTNENLIKESPEVVQAFVDATMRGWLWAMENTEDTYDIIIGYNDQLTPSHLAYEAEVTKDLMTDFGAVERVGWNYQDTWDGYMQILIDQGALAEPVPFAEAVDNSFVEKFYAEYEQ
jgi:ABC-type nitrate/sulfonate/bicarbonate transport system substrate-binding protein